MQKSKKFLLAGLILFLIRFIPWYPYEARGSTKLVSLASGRDFCSGIGSIFVKECDWFLALSMILLWVAVIVLIIGVILHFKEKKLV